MAASVTGSVAVAADDLPSGTQGWWRSGFELYNGVFEGGGAKGLAYVGALAAVHEHRVWFHRVAGASVGSIIAALIASGLTVEQFEAVLKNVRTMFPPVSGIRGYARLRRQAGVLDPTDLRTYLESVLVAQVIIQSGAARPDNGMAVTFRELFHATGIELNVLAIDILDRREVIFTHTATPDCQVVDAVIASSAIPGFFPPGRLCIRRSDTVVLAHPIVDGGVWANFPLFVFRDERFRAFHDLEQLTTAADRQVMGFLLEESQLVTTEQRRSRYAEPLKDSQFWRPGDAVLPAELTLLTDDETITRLALLPTQSNNFKSKELELAARRAVGTSQWFYRPWTAAATFADIATDTSEPEKSWNSTAELPWLSVIPGHKSRIVRSLRYTSQTLRTIKGLVLVALIVAAFLLGIYVAGEFVVDRDILYFTIPYVVILVPILLGVAYGLAWLLFGNVFFARAIERYGYLVGSTLASAGAVRYWMDGDRAVEPSTGRRLTTIVRIPVPDDLGTLDFQYVDVDFAVDFAKASVGEQLDALGLRQAE